MNLTLFQSFASKLITGHEIDFIISSLLALVCGSFIGYEREANKKAAGISTHCFVVSGAMLFTFMSVVIDPASPARIAAQVVSGVGFIGAGIIMKGEGGKIGNLTTAADLWFSSAIGLALGFRYYGIAILAMFFALIIFKLPSHSSIGKAKHKLLGRKPKEENDDS